MVYHYWKDIRLSALQCHCQFCGVVYLWKILQALYRVLIILCRQVSACVHAYKGNHKSHVQDEVEDMVKKLQVENSRLEAELRHEQERTEMLQAELADSQKVR